MTEENKITPETVEKKKRVVRKKNDIYKENQQEVVKKLNEILGITDTNNKFILEELKRDEEKQGKILGLEEEVKKYFACHDWAYFKNRVNNKWLCLMRSIYRECGYELLYKLKTRNGEKMKEYQIIKPLG